jgi:micrococcal nuclease
MRGKTPPAIALLLGALLLLVALLVACTPATVTHVVDGDTVDVVITGQDPDSLLIEGQTYRVRLTGIDTPEVYGGEQCYGPEASAFTKSLLEGRDVTLEKDVTNTDRYDRLLRYIWADVDPARPGMELVNEEIIRAGYAYASTYPPDVKYADRFLAAQEEARTQGAGLWGVCESPAPSSTPPPTATPKPPPTATPKPPPTATPKPPPTATPKPPPTATPLPLTPPPVPTTRVCCKYCTTGKACGDTCISRSYTCHQPPGCACNRY